MKMLTLAKDALDAAVFESHPLGVRRQTNDFPTLRTQNNFQAPGTQNNSAHPASSTQALHALFSRPRTEKTGPHFQKRQQDAGEDGLCMG